MTDSLGLTTCNTATDTCTLPEAVPIDFPLDYQLDGTPAPGQGGFVLNSSATAYRTLTSSRLRWTSPSTWSGVFAWGLQSPVAVENDHGVDLHANPGDQKDSVEAYRQSYIDGQVQKLLTLQPGGHSAYEDSLFIPEIAQPPAQHRNNKGLVYSVYYTEEEDGRRVPVIHYSQLPEEQPAPHDAAGRTVVVIGGDNNAFSGGINVFDINGDGDLLGTSIFTSSSSFRMNNLDPFLLDTETIDPGPGIVKPIEVNGKVQMYVVVDGEVMGWAMREERRRQAFVQSLRVGFDNDGFGPSNRFDFSQGSPVAVAGGVGVLGQTTSKIAYPVAIAAATKLEVDALYNHVDLPSWTKPFATVGAAYGNYRLAVWGSSKLNALTEGGFPVLKWPGWKATLSGINKSGPGMILVGNVMGRIAQAQGHQPGSLGHLGYTVGGSTAVWVAGRSLGAKFPGLAAAYSRPLVARYGVGLLTAITVCNDLMPVFTSIGEKIRGLDDDPDYRVTKVAYEAWYTGKEPDKIRDPKTKAIVGNPKAGQKNKEYCFKGLNQLGEAVITHIGFDKYADEAKAGVEWTWKYWKSDVEDGFVPAVRKALVQEALATLGPPSQNNGRPFVVWSALQKDMTLIYSRGNANETYNLLDLVAPSSYTYELPGGMDIYAGLYDTGMIRNHDRLSGTIKDAIANGDPAEVHGQLQEVIRQKKTDLAARQVELGLGIDMSLTQDSDSKSLRFTMQSNTGRATIFVSKGGGLEPAQHTTVEESPVGFHIKEVKTDSRYLYVELEFPNTGTTATVKVQHADIQNFGVNGGTASFKPAGEIVATATNSETNKAKSWTSNGRMILDKLIPQGKYTESQGEYFYGKMENGTFSEPENSARMSQIIYLEQTLLPGFEVSNPSRKQFVASFLQSIDFDAAKPEGYDPDATYLATGWMP